MPVAYTAYNGYFPIFQLHGVDNRVKRQCSTLAVGKPEKTTNLRSWNRKKAGQAKKCSKAEALSAENMLPYKLEISHTEPLPRRNGNCVCSGLRTTKAALAETKQTWLKESRECTGRK